MDAVKQGDRYVDVHGAIGRRASDKMTTERRCQLVVTGNSNCDQIAITEDPVGRINVDPAAAGKIDLYPGMGCAAAAMMIAIWRIDISADKSGGEPERPQCFDHQQCEIAAASRFQR